MKLQEQFITDEIANLIDRLKQLEDERAALLDKQRRLDADIIRHLAARKSKGQNDTEIRRDLSRFARNTLKLSRSVAASRCSAAVVAKTRPKLLTYIQRGEIGFTAIRAMEPYRDLDGLLEASVGKTRRQVEQAIAVLGRLNVEASEVAVRAGTKRANNKRKKRGKKLLRKSKAKRMKAARQPVTKRPRARNSV